MESKTSTQMKDLSASITVPSANDAPPLMDGLVTEIANSSDARISSPCFVRDEQSYASDYSSSGSNLNEAEPEQGSCIDGEISRNLARVLEKVETKMTLQGCGNSSENFCLLPHLASHSHAASGAQSEDMEKFVGQSTLSNLSLLPSIIITPANETSTGVSEISHSVGSRCSPRDPNLLYPEEDPIKGSEYKRAEVDESAYEDIASMNLETSAKVQELEKVGVDIDLSVKSDQRSLDRVLNRNKYLEDLLELNITFSEEMRYIIENIH